jgi:undecaprenyl-diphosphatase
LNESKEWWHDKYKNIGSDYMKVEFAILDWIQGMRHPILDQIMRLISQTGNQYALFYIIGFSLFLANYTRKQGGALIISLALASLVSRTFKIIFDRPRPFHIREIDLIIPYLNSQALPSTHATGAFVFAFVVSHYFKRYKYLAYGYAVLMAFSRMYLYVHFFTDVVVGAILGILIGKWMVYLVESQALMKKKWA